VAEKKVFKRKGSSSWLKDSQYYNPARLKFANKKEREEFIGQMLLEESLMEESMIRQARVDPCVFIEYVMKDDSPDSGNRKIELAKFQRDQLIPHFMDNPNAIAVIPREHGKTTILIGLILWLIGNNPNIRVKLVCNSDDNAKKRLGKIVTYMMHDPDFKKVFPDIKPDPRASWTKTAITVKRDTIAVDPTIEACAVLSTATGGRADVLLVDDPVDARNTIQNPALQKTVKSVFKSVWMNILVPNGKIWYIATLWSKADLTHELMKNKRFKTLKIEVGPDYQTIWEDRWPRERLVEKRESIGSVEYDRNFRHLVVSDEDRIFSDYVLSRLPNDRLGIEDIPDSWSKFGGIDLAISKRLDSAYTVMFTIAVNPENNHRVVCEIARGRYSSPETAQMIARQFDKWKHQMIYLETNGYQRAIKEWMEVAGYSIIPMRSFFTGATSKMDIATGVSSIGVEMENGNWEIPMKNHEESGMIGGDQCRCSFHKYLTELRHYPLSETTDIVMASWLAREAARRYRGGSFIRVIGESDPEEDHVPAPRLIDSIDSHGPLERLGIF